MGNDIEEIVETFSDTRIARVDSSDNWIGVVLLQRVLNEIRGLRKDLFQRDFFRATPEERARMLAGFKIDLDDIGDDDPRPWKTDEYYGDEET
jgi:hypothetical protein